MIIESPLTETRAFIGDLVSASGGKFHYENAEQDEKKIIVATLLKELENPQYEETVLVDKDFAKKIADYIRHPESELNDFHKELTDHIYKNAGYIIKELIDEESCKYMEHHFWRGNDEDGDVYFYNQDAA